MDLYNKCRTCLRIPKLPTDLFKDNDNLLQIILNISSVKIEYINKLPTQICEECCSNLITFHKFRQIIINTELELQRLLETLKEPSSNVKLETKSFNSSEIDTIQIKSEIEEDMEFTEVKLEDNIDIKEINTMKKIKKKIFKCLECELVFTLRHQLYNHRRSSHIPPRTCKICGITVRADNFKRHLKRHGHVPYSLVTDPDNSPEDNVDVYPATEVEKVFKCQNCEEVFKVRQELYSHRKKKHRSPKICNICGKTLLRADGFKKHLETHFRNRCKCNKCEKTFKNPELFKLHMNVHPEQRFACEICHKTFISKRNLQSHRHTLHVSPGKCNICDKIIRADHLKKHMLIHTEEPSTCDKCGKTLKNSQSLRSHKLMHIEQSFICEICGKRSESKRSHFAHLRVHKDSDQNVCVQCGKKVTDIKNHMRIHRGDRPFVCSYCNRRFRRAHHLTVHTRQHTKERPYKCVECNQAFVQSVSLRTHLKTKHGL